MTTLALVLVIVYGLYSLVKPVQITRFPKQAVKDFNERYKKGFYNGPQENG